MQASELRIGNFVIKSLKSGNGRKIEAEIGHADIARIFEGTGSFNYEPIPITEEWLVRFGFEDDGPEWYFLKVKDKLTSIGYSYSIKREVIEFCDIEITIEYVHQLQNLYFALTGTELTIKPC